MNNKKIIIISSIIIAVLVLTLGITYSIFSLSKVSKNSSLVVGDIYMHYNETTNSINITDMMPMGIYKVNTSTNKVTECVEYLKTTYGDTWNNLISTDSSANPTYNKNKAVVKQMKAPSNIIGTYAEYCSCKKITGMVNSNLQSNNNQEVLVKQMAGQTITKTIYMINDLENGTLTETDKKYFLDNGIIEDSILGLPYFEFTIDEKNTHTKYGVNYNIELVHGDTETNKTRIEDKFLKFRLVEVNNNQETILKDKLTIENINNTTIYSSTIPANTTSEITRTYRLYMWINEKVNICGGNQVENCDYTVFDWSNLFASIKVNVNGKYVDATNFVEAIKNRYNGNNQDGLVAVNTSGNLATTSDTIREYRYSGIGNYCTYTNGTNDYNLSVSGSTCPSSACLLNGAIINGDNEIFALQGKTCTALNGSTLNLKNNQTIPTDSGIRNYVTFNNETWRIVGIFNEENASGEKAERIKLVKDEPISASTEVPTIITKNSITYQMFNATSGTKYKYFYWNKPSSVETNKNDWTKAGSMYYLNENYLNSLENSNLIENMKYYLGNVNTDNGPITGTAKEVYTQERGSTVCNSSITSNSHENNCNIWNGNQAIWNGKIALLYPSDFGYASNTSKWSKDFKEAYSNGISLNNWMYNNISSSSWFLSPASYNPSRVAYVNGVGSLLNVDASRDDGLALRPVLTLGSQTNIISGTGSINDPYILNAE